MKLRIKGTYRHRVRVNFLLFWIVQKWKTDSFDQFITLNEKNEWKGALGPVTVTAKVENMNVVFSASYMGVTLYEKQVAIPPTSLPVHAEPIKGAVLNATLSIE